MKIFDTHIHFNTDQLRSKFSKIVESDSNYFYNIVSTNLTNSFESLNLSKKYDNTFCSIGIHPLEIENINEDEINEKFTRLLKSNAKILAIGETGLDFYHVDKKDHLKTQTHWLMQHYNLSKKFDLPLILHVRNAYKEIIYLLQNHINWYGIIHCFDGSVENLIDILRLEKWMISISPIMYRDVNKFKEIIKLTPIERLLIESDAPWLIKNNIAIIEIIELIAMVKRMPKEDVGEILFKNSLKIFKLA